MGARSRARLAPVAGAAALALTVSVAAAAPPERGVLVPGSSLGGIRLGMTKAQVKAAWGTHLGRCRSCLQETWYFTYRPFEPEGAAVAFAGRRVARLYTLWQPDGWRTSGGLRVGMAADEVQRRLDHPPRVECGDYVALVQRRGRDDTIYYLSGGELWGLGLTPRGASPCVELAAPPPRRARPRAG